METSPLVYPTTAPTFSLRYARRVSTLVVEPLNFGTPPSTVGPVVEAHYARLCRHSVGRGTAFSRLYFKVKVSFRTQRVEGSKQLPPSPILYRFVGPICHPRDSAEAQLSRPFGDS